jgi:hypothetical protein
MPFSPIGDVEPSDVIYAFYWQMVPGSTAHLSGRRGPQSQAHGLMPLAPTPPRPMVIRRAVLTIGTLGHITPRVTTPMLGFLKRHSWWYGTPSWGPLRRRIRDERRRPRRVDVGNVRISITKPLAMSLTKFAPTRSRLTPVGSATATSHLSSLARSNHASRSNGGRSDWRPFPIR